MSDNDIEQPGAERNGEGQPSAANVPPRPVTPPNTDASADAAQEPVSKISGAAEQTQALPRHSGSPLLPPAPQAPAEQAAPKYGQALPAPAPAPTYANAAAPGPYGSPTPDEHSSAFGTSLPPVKQRATKKFTSGALIVGMVAAALLGAGGAVGANYVMGSDATTTASTVTPQGDVVINNPENVTAVTAAAAKASPSVVTIEVSSGSTGGSGSGIILDTEGHILTNTHVVTLGGVTADPTITVRTNDGKVHDATLVGTDPLSDLAIIKIDAQNLVPATLGSSSKLNVGDTAIAIGAPLGLAGTVTDGIVSTLNRTISVASSAVPEETDSSGQSEGDSNQFNFQFPGEQQQQQGASTGSIYINVIQTDAAINHGNSGGALVDVNGNIIGVNVAIASSGSTTTSSDQSGSIGVGFAIPIDYAKRIANELIANGKATHGLLGVSVQAKAAEVKSGSTSSFSVGAEVASVVAGGAGEKAGLQKGDVITGVDSRAISDSSSLTAAIREIAVGGTAEIHYTRNGQEESVTVTVGENTGE